VPTQKKEWVEYGMLIRSVRDRLKLDRYQLGKLIGVAEKTVGAVECGHQGLGRGAKAAFEKLVAEADKPSRQYSLQTSAIRIGDDDDTYATEPDLAAVFAFAVDPDVLTQAEEISRVAKCSLAEALAFLYQRRPKA